MKKIVSFLLLVFTCVTINAKPKSLIYIDKAEDDGSRLIVSKYTFGITIGAMGVFMGNITCISADDNYFYIGVSYRDNYHPVISQGRVMLLKMEDGSLIELANTKDISEIDYEIVRGQFITYTVTPIYKVTKQQLSQIISGNVVKVRIETDIDNIDFKVSGNKFSKGIQEAYIAVTEALQKENNKYSDF